MSTLESSCLKGAEMSRIICITPARLVISDHDIQVSFGLRRVLRRLLKIYLRRRLCIRECVKDATGIKWRHGLFRMNVFHTS